MEPKNETSQILNSFKNFENILKEKLILQLGSAACVSSSVIRSNDPFLEDSSSLKNMSIGAKYEEKQWEQKTTNLVAFHDSVLNSKNNVHVLMAKIYFTILNGINGEIDYIREYNQKIPIREFAITDYNVENESFQEVAASWEDAVELVIKSVEDFNFGRETFIKERITKHKHKHSLSLSLSEL